MNLNKEDVEEVNQLLSDLSLELPPYRRVVTGTGGNYLWLRKHIKIRNKNLSPRLVELLGLDEEQ